MDSLSFYFKRPIESDLGKKVFQLSSTGIPADAIVILCPQTLPKFHPIFDEAMHKILDQNEKVYIIATYNKDKIFWKNQ